VERGKNVMEHALESLITRRHNEMVGATGRRAAHTRARGGERTLSTATLIPTMMTNASAVRLMVARRPRLREPHIAARVAK
jgi:hypothetical protein